MILMDENSYLSEEELRTSTDRALEKELSKINAQLDKEILFALIGDVNVGKSATINRLMGEETAKVGAKPGETTEIAKYNYKGKDKIIFVDTPGLNDINSQNSKETLDFYRKADVILFMLNAAGTVFSEPEKKCFEEIKSVNKEIILVLNKIDAIEENDINEQVEYINKNTNGEFKIIPISSKTGTNIDKLRDTILDILEQKGKDILFARFLKDKASTASKWILAASASAAAIGFAPLPGADVVPITSIQIGLLIRLAVLYHKPLSKETAKELVLSTITGGIGKTIFRQILKVFPGAGQIAGAGVAGTMTCALGYSVKYAYENNINLDSTSLKALYHTFYNKAKNK